MDMKLRILHLEDSGDDATLIRLALERSGLPCEIVQVDSGEAYGSALQTGHFDVILSDSGVPGYDGHAALGAASACCPGVPFIIVSGGMPESVQAAAPGQCARWRVMKSDLAQLAPVIRMALGTASAALDPTASAAFDSATYVAGMRQLVSVVQELSMARSLQAAMDIVRHAARMLVDADGATFVIKDGDHCFYAEEDAISPLWKGQRFPLSACISGWSMLNRQAAVIEDIYQDPRIPHDAYRPTFVKSLVMTPIRTLSPVGAIGVYWAHPHRATNDQIELLRALADSASVAMESVEILANLEKRVSERTAEVRRRTAELEVLNKELAAFSYSVAHDLRAPLITIDGFSQVLLETHADRLDATGRAHLERISRGTRRMHGLINDLLNLSKIVRAPMRPASLDLTAISLEIVSTLREAAPQRSMEVSIAPGIRAEGDPGLVRIALENLFSNAWKYTAKANPARVEFGIGTDRGGLQALYVRDNGAGFDPRHASNLFGPFQRLHTEAQFPGTGIGLATVQRIIHRHGGQIWAEAAVDQGACFFFTLPAFIQESSISATVRPMNSAA